MANIRITPTDHRAALSLYTGQAARTREDHTRRPSPEAVAQAEANQAAALAELERLQQADPAGEYSACEYLELKGGQP